MAIIQAEVERLEMLATCFSNISPLLAKYLTAEQVRRGPITNTMAEEALAADCGYLPERQNSLPMLRTSCSAISPRSLRGARITHAHQAKPVVDRVATYKPPINILDVDAFLTLDADSALMRSLLTLNDAVLLYENTRRNGVSEEDASDLVPRIDAELLVNGCLSIDYSLGYPVLNDSVLWERWDCESGTAYKWFRQYLTMNVKYGFRNFGQFLALLTGTVKGEKGFWPAIVAVGPDATNEEASTGAGSAALVNIDELSGKQEIARIKAYYHLHYWEDRCLCYDMWEAAALKERRQKRSRDLLDEQFEAFTDVFEKVQARVLSSVESMDPRDAIKAMQDIAKLLRVNVGMPADRPADFVEGPSIVNANITNNNVGNPGDTPDGPAHFSVHFIASKSSEEDGAPIDADFVEVERSKS